MSISDLKDDTSLHPFISALDCLGALTLTRPFNDLLAFIESTGLRKYSNHGSEDFRAKLAGMRSESVPANELKLYENLTNADCLNEIAQRLTYNIGVSFSDSALFVADKRYYEEIIYESKEVPTRRNWHDFFNGLIWTQFPKTKSFLNETHMQEIALTASAKKRTPVRDRLTHFDECGLILFTSCSLINTQIKEHQWQELFVRGANKWHTSIIPLVFGHALWEMLLAPFIGLTAKVSVIELSDGAFENLQAMSKRDPRFYAHCDQLIHEHLIEKQILKSKRPWLPLPLLGIPEWAHCEQSKEFYDNADYFMPKRQKHGLGIKGR